MSTRNNNTVCKNVSAGWAITWVTLIGGMVIFSDPNPSIYVSSTDAWDAVGGTIKLLTSLLK